MTRGSYMPAAFFQNIVVESSIDLEGARVAFLIYGHLSFSRLHSLFVLCSAWQTNREPAVRRPAQPRAG